MSDDIQEPVGDGVPEPVRKRSARGRKTCTAAEMEQRVEFAAFLISKKLPSTQIKAALKNRYGCSDRMAEKYRARGRQMLADAVGKPREVYRAEAIAWYESVIHDPSDGVTMGHKLVAQAELNKLLGLYEPIEHVVTGKDGGPIRYKAEEMTDDDLIHEIAKLRGVPGGANGRIAPPAASQN